MTSHHWRLDNGLIIRKILRPQTCDIRKYVRNIKVSIFHFPGVSGSLLTIRGSALNVSVPSLVLSALVPQGKTELDSMISISDRWYRYFYSYSCDATIYSQIRFWHRRSRLWRVIEVSMHFAPTVNGKAFFKSNLDFPDDSMLLTLSMLMEKASPKFNWPAKLFDLLIQNLLLLQPLYYSIATFAVISPKRIDITVAVVINNNHNGMADCRFQGPATNYLYWYIHLDRHQHLPLSLRSDSRNTKPKFFHEESRNQVLIDLRPSLFKLPSNPSRPIIMMAAGSATWPSQRSAIFAFHRERKCIILQLREVPNLAIGVEQAMKNLLGMIRGWDMGQCERYPDSLRFESPPKEDLGA